MSNDNLQVDALRTAAEWFVQLTSDTLTPEDHAAWQAWRKQTPANEYAWQQVENVSRKFSMSGLSPSVGLATLERPASPGRRRALQQMAILFALGGASWASYRHVPWQQWSADYVTAVGEQRHVILQDGSRLTLNTNSAVDVMFTRTERRLSLRKGEILVETQQERGQPYRPLVAATTHGEVTATGTVFALRRKDKLTRVDLFEGGVTIRAAARPASIQPLLAGEAARFNADVIHKPFSLMQTQPNWLNGMLVADDMPLIDFLNEVARYRQGYLGGEQSLLDLRISGAFPIDNTDKILDSLTRVLPVEVQRFTSYWVNVKRRTASLA